MQSLRFSNRGSILPLTLVASVIIGLAALSTVMLTNFSSREAAMTIDPTELTTTPGQTFTISVLVSSALPVNAFTGMITFDQAVLGIEKIDYNTSIADLWTEEPWFSQGAGTINFTGGTTRTGGFTGTGSLITVTFRALTAGPAHLVLQNARILQHDGFGTDAQLSTPIDSVFTVIPEDLHTVDSHNTNAVVTVTPNYARTDLNHDGQTNLGDISVFMLYLATQDTHGDVSGDGHVNTTDLSLILGARGR